MSRVVLLGATKKGAFFLRGTRGRDDWKLEGPHQLGHVVHHVVLDPRDGQTLLMAAKTGHLGPTVFRSRDWGQTWTEAKQPPAFAAYFLTGSVGLLSDALESGVNLVTAVFALIILTIAAQPPDEEHEYGHTKAEYFSGGFEGSLILIAALVIAVTAVQRLLQPQPLEQVSLGLIVSVLASVGNGLTALVLLRVGRQQQLADADSQRPPPAHRRLDFGRGDCGFAGGEADRLAVARPAAGAAGGAANCAYRSGAAENGRQRPDGSGRGAGRRGRRIEQGDDAGSGHAQQREAAQKE